MPLPMCMALPFYLGAWLAIDMCIGACIMLLWKWRNRAGGWGAVVGGAGRCRDSRAVTRGGRNLHMQPLC